MPKRSDLRHVLVIGSGPIVIGQACEFDYSGTQACRVLRAEGLRVSLVNSNPATIMTDPEFADATYIEPVIPEYIEKVIARERPDALLPTLGGQTALNAAVALHEAGVLDKYGVELIGANIDAIRRGEDRQLFKDVVMAAVLRAGIVDTPEQAATMVPRSRVCHSLDEVRATVAELGLPVVIRPSFTMGGLGSGMAHTPEDLERLAGAGLRASPVHEVLIEESVLGWKEFELELMRDRKDNVVVVCSIENVDPMGVHTGDSVTVAPAMTLTDREYQRMRDVGIAVLREVGVDTGGCNIQFAVHPRTGRLVVIEMNPRVSRSSALASKATGFPIAKIAAKLAIGYTLDEIPNDITRQTPAAFEPTLDYVVVKIPRFAFEKFPGADAELTTTMKSVGEVMALGRSFPEALNKAMRSLETPRAGFWTKPDAYATLEEALEALRTPHDGRLYTVELALRLGATVEQVSEASGGIDPWFIDQIASLVELREEILNAAVLDERILRRAKRAGLSDAQLAALRPELSGEDGVRALRHRVGLRPVYKTVDTCAAEFAASTPYHYSSYDEQTEVAPSARPKVIILGSGPNRIGQGIEFDYSCVHAVQALRSSLPGRNKESAAAGDDSINGAAGAPAEGASAEGVSAEGASAEGASAEGVGGYETIMINCNPETVSTDYDTADRLYFEPLTFEDVLEVYHAEDSSGRAAGGPGVVGVIVQLGGQTPLGLARRLAEAGLPIVGTSPESIHLAEDRGAFGALLDEAGLVSPAHGTATSFEEAKRIADEIGYPVLVRPSYVLGGRGMEIVYDDVALRSYITRATDISPEHPVLVDRFLDDAIEIDVDALVDATGDVYLGGIMEHIEEAGIHSGDSACALPPITLVSADIAKVRAYTEAIGRAIGVRGLLNVQYALKDERLYVLEANPRASRTVPFVSKATGVPLAKAAARIMLGATIAQLRAEGLLAPTGDGATLPLNAPTSVKEAVLPFRRFRTTDGKGVDSLLGPEMKSTGEVMGIDASFGHAYAKSQAAAYGQLPTQGRILVTVSNRDKRAMIFPVKRLADLGFSIVATEGTAEVLRRHGVECDVVGKHYKEAMRNAVSLISSGEVALVINTPQGSGARQDGYEIRVAAVAADIPLITTIPGAAAAVMGIEALIRGEMTVRPLQELHAALRAQTPSSPTPSR
jgi:carbamoyl-phosphate synthase large subunit